MLLYYWASSQLTKIHFQTLVTTSLVLEMAASRAANVAEMAVGHSGNATVTTDVSNYGKEGYGEDTGAKIKATTWQGKNSVKVGVCI